MIPTQVFTSTDQLQRVNLMNSTLFLIWRYDFLQTVRRFLRSSCSSWCSSIESNKNQKNNPVPRLCVTMLQTRFFLVETFAIRRFRITKFLRMMSTVSSCFRAVLHGARTVFVSLLIAHFGFLGKCSKTLCLPISLPFFGPLDLSATNGRSVDSSSELTLDHQVFSLLAQLQVVPRHCVSRVRRGRDGVAERPSLSS